MDASPAGVNCIGQSANLRGGKDLMIGAKQIMLAIANFEVAARFRPSLQPSVDYCTLNWLVSSRCGLVSTTSASLIYQILFTDLSFTTRHQRNPDMHTMHIS